MRRLPALAFVALLAGCSSPPPAVAPKVATVVAPAAIPACPESILPGGDPLESEGFEGKPVVRVCVVGGSEESRKSAERVGLLRAGDTFTADRLRADLDGLMKLGTFEDVAAYGLRVRDGASVVVFYALRDRPRISQIGFEGAKVLGDTALSTKLPIAKGAPFDPTRVTVIAQAVREEYRQRGYESALVVLVTEPGTAPDGTREVRVRIKVEEGPLVHFSRIDFRGNKVMSEADLRKVAALKIGQPYVRDEVDRAALLLTAMSFDRGLVQMRVDVELGARDASGGLPLVFVIDEGEVHTIGKLRFTKVGTAVEKELLETVVRARSKQVFSRSALVADIERVKAYFAQRSQAVEVVPLTEVDAKKKTVDLTLEIDAR